MPYHKQRLNSCWPYPYSPDECWFAVFGAWTHPVKSNKALDSLPSSFQLKYLLIGNQTHFSTENSPPSGFSPPSPAGLSKRRGGRLSTGRLSVGGRPSPWLPWGLEPSPSGLRPILLMPAPRIDHNRRIRGPIALIDWDPPLSPWQEKEEELIVLLKWSKKFQLTCRIKELRQWEGSIHELLWNYSPGCIVIWFLKLMTT